MREWRVSDGWVTGRKSLRPDIQVVRVKKWRVTGKIEIHSVLRQFTVLSRFGIGWRQNANTSHISLSNYVVEVSTLTCPLYHQSIILGFVLRICMSYKIFRIQNHFTFVYETDLLSYTKIKRNSHGYFLKSKRWFPEVKEITHKMPLEPHRP